jgi:hypothetical protein
LVDKNPNGSSGKLIKARNMGVKILTADSLEQMIKKA